MPICAGDAERKPGQPATIFVDTAYMASILPAQLQWLRPFLPYVPPIPIDVEALCDLQPTDIPLLDSAEMLTLLTRNPYAIAAAATAKVTRIVQAFLWYRLCQCVAASTPAPPAGQAEPADLPVINPPTTVQPNASTGCLDLAGQSAVFPWNGARPWIPDHVMSPFPPIEETRFALPPNATSVSVTATNTPDAGHPSPVDLFPRIVWWTSPTTTHATATALGTLAPNATLQVTVAVPIASPWGISLQYTASVGADNQTISGSATVYCNGDLPGQVAPACCPPDPSLLARLDQLYGLVVAMQRQGVPFAYVPGDVTGALEDNGQVALSGPCVAVSLLLTTVPSHYGMAEGDPDRIFEVGWLARGTADGFEAPRRITTSPFYLRLGGEHTRIGYSLAPGVVGELREHLGEP